MDQTVLLLEAGKECSFSVDKSGVTFRKKGREPLVQEIDIINMTFFYKVLSK